MSHFDKFVQTFKVAYTYRSQISTNDANINILLSHPDDITLNLLKYLVISSATSNFVGEKLMEFFFYICIQTYQVAGQTTCTYLPILLVS